MTTTITIALLHAMFAEGQEVASNITSLHVGFQPPQTFENTEVDTPGFIPLQYEVVQNDDEDPESLPEDYSSAYEPIIISDEELLQRQPMVLSSYTKAPEIIIYCYPFGEDEIMTKCLPTMEYFGAAGVYLPMMAEIGTERTQTYYNEVKKLRKVRRQDGARYKIHGVAYNNPNWSLMTQILMKNPLFDGIMLEWVGNNACIWNMNAPTRGQIDTIVDLAGPISYFFRNQECDDAMMLQNGYNGAFINPNDDVDVSDISITPGTFPKFIKPIFPCFQGQEGPCYRAFRQFGKEACSTKQRYAFSPYEPLGNLMMYFVNETCQGMPEHDLYSVA